MKKVLLIIFTLFLCTTSANALSVKKNSIEKVLIKNNVSANKESMSVSVVNVSNPKQSYELNSKRPISPASVQKLLTIIPSIVTLGENYEFQTKLYKDIEGNYYIKLGADPYLTTKDLKKLFSTLENKEIKKSIYIDDSILDGMEWGEGWQWDDELNPSTPKFGAYNLDSNLIGVSITPTTLNSPPEIQMDVFYPTCIINQVLTGKKTDIIMTRKNYISPDELDISGTVNDYYTEKIPVNYPRRYFVFRLSETFKALKISYYGDFKRLKTPKKVTLISEIKHPISNATTDVFLNSDNMVAETLFKLAGGKFTNSTGTQAAGIDMLVDFDKQLGIDYSNIRVVDGSGVSKNNLVTAEYVTDFLTKLYKNDKYKHMIDYMATSGQGTLRNRMLYFKGNIKAKTGTLADISTIAGYLTSEKGNVYAFCIMNNSPNISNNDKKMIEEYILRDINDKL